MRRPRPELAPRRQRVIVLLALSLVATAALAVLGIGGDTRASAALPDGPFSCGPTDNNRQSVSQWNGSISNSATVGTPMKPCLSGTSLTLTIPPRDNSGSISSVQRLTNPSNITIADGSTIGNVVQIGFKGFTINSSASGVSLTTSTGTAVNYGLTLAPDNGAVFGGGDVVTDLLVDADSTIVINNMPAYIPIILDTCALLGGTGGSTCTVRAGNINQSLVSLANAIGISTFNIREMHLKIYYIVTHNTSGGDPSGAAFQFPNTTITAGDN